MRRATAAPVFPAAQLGRPFASRYYPAAPAPITRQPYSVMHSCVST